MKNYKREIFFLVLGGGKDSIPLIKKIQDHRCKVVLVDKDPNCPAFHLADINLILSTWDPDQIIEELNSLEVCLCVTRSSGYPAFSAVFINKYLNLTSTDPEKALSLINKKKIYELDIHEIIKLPKLLDESQIDILNSDFPMICKPAIEKIGKITTFKINSPSMLKGKATLAMANAVDKEILFQEYIDGVDVSILGYVFDDVYKSQTIINEVNSFQPTQGSVIHQGFSIRNDPELMHRLTQISQDIVNYTKLNFCPLNLSFRISSKELFLVEINLDFGGEGIHEYLEDNLGIDIINNFLLDYLNRKQNLKNI